MRGGSPRTSVAPPARSIRGTVYYPGIKEAVRQYDDQLAAKVVVDITSPVDTQTWDRLATPPGTSSREGLQHHLRPHARRRQGR
jgi:predicted dinucleotide-binding enzyme